MSDPIEFLEARIAEDEEAAWRAGSAGWLHRSLYRHPRSRQSVYSEDRGVAEVEYTDGWHIARHDPARVLAECAAKREILKLETNHRVTKPDVHGDVTINRWGNRSVEINGHRMAHSEYIERSTDPAPLSSVLRALFLPYTSHPDYDPAWRD